MHWACPVPYLSRDPHKSPEVPDSVLENRMNIAVQIGRLSAGCPGGPAGSDSELLSHWKTDPAPGASGHFVSRGVSQTTFLFTLSPEDMFIDFRERGRERERERNIDWLPPVCAATGGQTHNFLLFVG